MATIEFNPNPAQVDQGVDIKVWTTYASVTRCIVEYSGAAWGSDEVRQWGNYWWVMRRFSQPGTVNVRATLYDNAGYPIDNGWAYLEVKLCRLV